MNMYLSIWNSIIAVVGFVSSAITIAMFFQKGCNNIWGRIASILLVALFAASIVQNIIIQKQNTIIAQKENIAVHATQVLEQTGSYDAYCSISTYVSFLESVREIYPDSYERACEIYKSMDNSGYSLLSSDSTISADVSYKKLHGIVVGIAALNE